MGVGCLHGGGREHDLWAVNPGRRVSENMTSGLSTRNVYPCLPTTTPLCPHYTLHLFVLTIRYTPLSSLYTTPLCPHYTLHPFVLTTPYTSLSSLYTTPLCPHYTLHPFSSLYTTPLCSHYTLHPFVLTIHYTPLFSLYTTPLSRYYTLHPFKYSLHTTPHYSPFSPSKQKAMAI